MQVPSIYGLQQIPQAVPLLHGPNYQLALLHGDVDGRTRGYLRLNRE